MRNREEKKAIGRKDNEEERYDTGIIIRVFRPRVGPSLQAQESRLQFCRRQVFQRKPRSQDCSFTMD